VVYIIFDLLFLDGHELFELPYTDRRRLLTQLIPEGRTWQVPAHHVGHGEALREASRAQGLEGIVAKRLDSVYTPGRRTRNWVKVKNFRRADVVIGGWKRGDGGRANTLGSLAVGTYRDGELVYAGNVGTGFTQAELKRVLNLLEPLTRATSPFTGSQPEKGTVFVEPELVAIVDYGDVTKIGTLRHPVYKGIRDDIDPRTVGPPEE
jgi:bifunctional non-homologous end joining protein LigD